MSGPLAKKRSYERRKGIDECGQCSRLIAAVRMIQEEPEGAAGTSLRARIKRRFRVSAATFFKCQSKTEHCKKSVSGTRTI
jgi:hypothetical protein